MALTPSRERRRRRSGEVDSDVSDSDTEHVSEGTDDGEDSDEESSEGTVRGKNEDPVVRLEHVAASLGTHVRGLRDAAESLAGQTWEEKGEEGGDAWDGGAASTREMWGMLVFALQDWKDVVALERP